MASVSFQQMGSTQRVPRRPAHPFDVRFKAFEIQPFCIAPVLPGETMKNLLVQARVQSDAVLSPRAGWWLDTYFFYVKHRDMEERDDLTEMMLDANKDLSGLHEADFLRYYHKAGHVPWVKMCLKRVVAEYFRIEGEAWNAAMSAAGVPFASVNVQSWLDSLTLESEVSTYDVDLTDVGSPGGAAVTASEIEDSMRTWHFMRHNQLTDMSYEDYLATYGIAAPAEQDTHRPELIRFMKNWTYPVNTVDPATGVPASHLEWTLTERADKDRRFTEPGFIFGVMVVRPKTYRRHQEMGAVGLLDTAYSWLPRIMSDDPATSLVSRAGATQPITNVATPWIADIKDLFLYGDQFVSFDPDATGIPSVSLPTTTGGTRYATDADATAMFLDAVTPKNTIRADGIVSLNILGSQIDSTPGNVGVLS